MKIENENCVSIIAIFEELENWFSCVISALDRLTFNGLGFEKDIGRLLISVFRPCTLFM